MSRPKYGFEVFDMNLNKLTPEEKRWLGIIKKPLPLKGTIHIVIPVRYGSRGARWESRFVTPDQLSSYRRQYPDMQILNYKGQEE